MRGRKLLDAFVIVRPSGDVHSVESEKDGVDLANFGIDIRGEDAAGIGVAGCEDCDLRMDRSEGCNRVLKSKEPAFDKALQLLDCAKLMAASREGLAQLLLGSPVRALSDPSLQVTDALDERQSCFRLQVERRLKEFKTMGQVAHAGKPFIDRNEGFRPKAPRVPGARNWTSSILRDG